MPCNKPVVLTGCGDTSLEAGGTDNVGRIFPDDANEEQRFWDSVAQEPAKLSGTPLRFWSIRRAKNMHPLYREPSLNGQEWSFHGPWEMMGAIEFEQGTEIDPEVSQEGLQKVSNAILWMARKEFEDLEAPNPKIGDVIEFWDREPFVAEFQYWDVVRANPDGNIFSSEAFVQYRIELKRRSRFEAGRKALGERI